MKYQVILTRTINGTEYVVKTLKYSGMPEKVRHANRTFLINYGTPVMISRDIATYIANVDTGIQFMPTADSQVAMSPEELDVIMGTKIVREITASVAKNPYQDLIKYIIGGIIGLLAGLLIGFLVMQAKIDAVPPAVQNSTQIVMSIVRGVRIWR